MTHERNVEEGGFIEGHNCDCPLGENHFQAEDGSQTLDATGDDVTDIYSDWLSGVTQQ